jgi:Protein of unknown function (DUF4031)
MTIYVDDCIWPWRGRRWCHCVSDTSYDELHEFVCRLGGSIEAFQGDHYDLDEARRSLAVDAGATEVSGRELVRRLRSAGLRRTRPGVTASEPLKPPKPPEREPFGE